jgi:hypothetical protein
MGSNEAVRKGHEKRRFDYGPLLAALVGLLLGASLWPVMFWPLASVLNYDYDSFANELFIILGSTTFGMALLFGGLVDGAVSPSRDKSGRRRRLRFRGLLIAGLLYPVGSFVSAGATVYVFFKTIGWV